MNFKKVLLSLAALGMVLSPAASVSQSAYSQEPADIPSSPDPATVAGPGGQNWVYNNPLPNSATSYSPYSGSDEGAFRTHCDPKFLSWSDPILYPGQPGSSHLHQVYGLGLTENEFANLTYTWGRNKANSVAPSESSCGGGALVNPSLYWHPALWNDVTDKVMIPNYAVVYYKMNRRDWRDGVVIREDNGLPPTPARVPRGFTYVWGYNVYNPSPANNTGWSGWKCEVSGGSALWLKNDDGSNTLPVTNGLACNQTVNGQREKLAATFSAPMCWNGTQLSTANGRDHVRHYYWDGNLGKMVCPTGYPYLIPHFDFIVWWDLKAGEDIREFYWDSDRMIGHPTRRNGESGHADWFGLWNYDKMLDWMHECVGYLDGDDAKVRSCSTTHFGDGTAGNAQNVSFAFNHATRDVDPPPDPSPGVTDKIILHTHGGPANPPVHIQNKVAVEGDSISVYGAGMYTGLFDTARPGVQKCYLASSGHGIQNLINDIATVTTCDAEVVTVFIGANDLFNSDPAFDSNWFLTKLWQYTDSLRSQGYKVAVATVLPNGMTQFPAPYNAMLTKRPIVNTAIRNAVGVHIDAVIDFAADSRIGDDADALDTAKYPDGQHPSGSTHAIMETIYTPVVDALLAQGGSGFLSIPVTEQTKISMTEEEVIFAVLIALAITGAGVYYYRTRRREEEETI